MPNSSPDAPPERSLPPDSPTILPAQLTAEQLERLALHPDSRVREGVVRHGNVPRRVLLFLSRDEDIYVRTAVATHRYAPCHALMILSRDESAYIRTMVAAHPRAPSDALDHLVDAPEFTVLKQVVRHPALRPTSLMRLAMGRLNTIEFVNRDNLPAEVIAILAGREGEFGLRILGCDTRTPIALVAGFLHRLDPLSLHVVVSRRRDLEPFMNATLRKQIAESSRLAREAAADPTTPSDVLAALSHGNDEQVLVRLAFNPATDTKTLIRLCKNHEVANAIAGRPDMTVDIAESLLELGTNALEEALAKNPKCPEATLMELTETGCTNARLAIARSRYATADMFDYIAQNDVNNVRCALIDNPAVPRELIAWMSLRDPDRAIRKAATRALRRSAS